jgi:hypothetical protein
MSTGFDAAFAQVKQLATDFWFNEKYHLSPASLVEQMLANRPQLARAQSDKDKDFYANKCAALDRQIDAMVYELYGLTADEIKIVEEAIHER